MNCVISARFDDIYIYIYTFFKEKKKTKTGYFRIINLFPSCFAFLVLLCKINYIELSIRKI